MQRKNQLWRALFILVLVVLAIYYLVPTAQTLVMDKELDERIAEMSDKSGVSETLLRDRIFQMDYDLVSEIRDRENLSESVRSEIASEIDKLRSDFYEDYSDAQNDAIKLGLDLQGGMYLVLEVDLAELMNQLARDAQSDEYKEISAAIHERLQDPTADFKTVVMEEFEKRDVPLARYFGDPNQSDEYIFTQLMEEAEKAVQRARTILTNRVDQFGVSEPSISIQGERRILMELPGIRDASRAHSLIGRTALLEFKLVAQPEVTVKVLQEIDKILAAAKDSDTLGVEADMAVDEGDIAEEDTPADAQMSSAEEELFGAPGEEGETADTDTATGDGTLDDLFADEETDTAAAEDTTVTMDADAPFTSLLTSVDRQIIVPAKNANSIKRFLSREDVQKVVPSEWEFLWGNKPVERGDQTFEWLYLVASRASMTGDALEEATYSVNQGATDPGRAGQPIVNLSMKREGAREFARITEANIGEHLAIVLDDKVHMAPRINSRIPNGQAIIEGMDSQQEAEDLMIVLNSGALPAPVMIDEERTVGPSLGADSIRKGAYSALIGMALVIVFMGIYYRFSGLVADVALLLNLLFMMAVLAGFGFTLTLPGIAGVILTVGIAVDANVLIFERIREELRTGKTVWNSIQAGYSRAFVTIMDANITTLIAAVVLYQFGTGPIKGFALTLMIGIIASMFTALVVTRAIFDWYTTSRTVKNLSI